MVIGLAVFAAAPAWADCAAEVQAMRRQLAAVTDEAHRQELALLLDKATKDAAEGRERLCIDAVVRAQALLK